MNLFSSLWKAAQPMFDRIMGEEFIFTPMQEVVSGVAIPDESRSVLDPVVGIPVIDGMDTSPGGQVSRVELFPRFSFQRDQFPQDAQQYDRLTRKSDGQMYEITDVRLEAIHRLLLHLKEIG